MRKIYPYCFHKTYQIIKRIKWILPLLCLAIMLGGCPYGSDVPIDNATVKIDPKLLGKWETKSSSEKYYVVTKKDDYHYAIEKKDAKGGDSDFYVAHFNILGSDRFLNIKEAADDAKTYYFYKLELSSTGVKATLIPVTENIDETFTTLAELKAYFEKYRTLSFFFDKTEDVYIKIE